MSTPNPQSSSRPSLLPSPLARNSPDPQPIQATSASIYSPEPEHSTSAYPPPVQKPEVQEQEGSVATPSFNPLFTFISDSTTGEFHHPSTYYVFADDESAADAIGTAALHSLDTYVHDPHSDRAREDLEIEERYVILDFTTDGAGIISAQSLAPRWAVTGAKIAAAPMFGDSAEGDGSGGVMVVVEGVSSATGTKGQGHDRQAMFQELRVKCGDSVTGAMSEILAGVNKGIDMLEKVVAVEGEIG